MGSRIAKNRLEALKIDELQKSKFESANLLQTFLQRMDETFDEVKNSVSEKLLALETKAPTVKRINPRPEVQTFVPTPNHISDEN
ncbi:unnamed protein product [Spirodela intermedia]|uniref:Uncharacterized protein n=1 Tax=Spirodela intermedia TaxID=51605 RepID=A0A7I8IQ21_SPIIN|nr:unnamed protein product [Spirodela intermedia]CAA6659674.1 unnamed protein product [Spirodela intermedia]